MSTESALLKPSIATAYMYALVLSMVTEPITCTTLELRRHIATSVEGSTCHCEKERPQAYDDITFLPRLMSDESRHGRLAFFTLAVHRGF
jgi:hypothetical protein